MTDYAYAVLEVGGIQKYILTTGKLKEMIGGSEMIESLGEYCHAICRDTLGLQMYAAPDTLGKTWYVPLQDTAGTIRVLFPNADKARAFLTAFSARMLVNCPGLPLYGTIVECSWTVASLKNAYKEAKDKIAIKRGQDRLAPKGMWPFCRTAPLDALPAVKEDKVGTRCEYISALSEARRNYKLIDKAEERLRGKAEEHLRTLARNNTLFFTAETPILWPTDMQDMFSTTSLQRIALIHMDGNDLGKEFRACLDTPNTRPEDFVQNLKDLSNMVNDANKEAFIAALQAIVTADMQDKKLPCADYTIPLRPLVLGGDDITVIVRADLAFIFIDTYTTAFEHASKKQGKNLTVGAGMIIMQDAYPFVRAFHLVEQLTESAKKLTADMSPRPSSLDYIVLSNDVNNDLAVLRHSTVRSHDTHDLTAKPFFCGTHHTTEDMYHIQHVLHNALDVLNNLPASGTRNAISECRKGKKAATRAWQKMRENIMRGLGDSKRTMSLATFDRIFPQGFFVDKAQKQQKTQCTFLGDYVELRTLNPHPVTSRREK